MRDVELYRQLLGIEAPWKVERVELSAACSSTPTSPSPTEMPDDPFIY